MLVYLSCFYVVMSLIDLVLYGVDKRKARRQKRRVPEKVLLGFGFFGGALGGLAGMCLFKHKTKHWYFWFLNYLFLALHFSSFFIPGVM